MTSGGYNLIQSSGGCTLTGDPAGNVIGVTPNHVYRLKPRIKVVPTESDAGATGLSGSITTTDVADAVKAAGGPVLEKRAIVLAAPIKTVGKHSAKVQVHPDVTATVTLEVVAG